MNGVTHEEKRKENAIKTLAIVGFTAVVVLAVYLAVQVVQLAPGAFTSLASMAEKVHGTPGAKELTVVTDKTVVKNGEEVTLSWNDTKTEGTYRFVYKCIDGVIISATTIEGHPVNITCGETIALNNDGEATLTVTSNMQRFADVLYTVTFTEESATEPSLLENNQITVVNANIPLSGIIAGATDNEETDVVVETPTEEPVTETPSEPAVVKPKPVTPTTPTYTYTYKLPESNPNGFTDLEMKYLGVGEIKNGAFIPRAEIDNDTEGAVRFQVKNIGTKTSEKWTYEVLLPNGTTYESPKQTGLKPNETATIVLGVNTYETGTQKIEGEVKVSGDRSSANNDFSWSVKVVN